MTRLPEASLPTPDAAPATPPTPPAVVASLRAVGLRRGRRQVLDQVDLAVHEGEVLALVGPNGGGKSSLLLLLAGLLAPDEGAVEVAGRSAVALSRTGRVGLIGARPGLYPLQTGRENLEFYGALHGLAPREVGERVAPLLAELDMAEHVDRPVAEYSSGMAQKVGLARALLLDPVLLLLDEPTSAMDPLSAEVVHEALARRARRGLAVLLVTHDLRLAEARCHRTAFLQRRVRWTRASGGEGAPGELLAAWRAWAQGEGQGAGEGRGP